MIPAHQFLDGFPAFFFEYELKPGHEPAIRCLHAGAAPLIGLISSDLEQNPSLLMEKMLPQDAAAMQLLLSKPAWEFSFKLPEAGWMEAKGLMVANQQNHVYGKGMIFQAGEKMTALEHSEAQLASLNELHGLIIRFSNQLVKAASHEVNDAINNTLMQLGEYAHVDRVYIFEHDAVADVVNNTFEWCSQGTSPEIDNLQGIPFDLVPRWKEKFALNEYVYIPLIAEIADEYAAEKEILEPQGIISLLALPMFYGSKLYGFIGFDAVKQQREWSEEHIALLRLAGEIIAGTIHRGRFETEIIEARRVAEEANNAKSDFLATMSHEIRTPMNAILGFSEILRNTSENEQSRTYLNAVLSSGRTLLALINDILDLSKIESGQLEINEQPVEMAAIINEIKQVFLPKVSEKQLYLNIHLQDGCPQQLLLDGVRLRQILFNIIGNAVKFTHHGGVDVDVSYHIPEDDDLHVDLSFAVSDTGIGIPEKALGKIFQSFFQVEGSNTRKYDGTGLGLAIAQRLVQAMGGTLNVVSTEGQGSVFTMRLFGIERTHFKTIPKDEFEWKGGEISFEPATILVVDDVEFNRDLVRSFLKNHQLKVLEAATGTEGVEMCSTHKPQLVLMDLRMPRMNGYDATEILRKQPETSQIPVIAFTASSMKHDEIRIRKLFSDYVRKPISRNELMATLTKFLPHRVIENQVAPAASNETELPFSQQQLEGFLDAFVLRNLDEKLALLHNFMDTDLLEAFLKDADFIARQFAMHQIVELIMLLREDKQNFDFGNYHLHIHQLSTLVNQLKHLRNTP